MRPIEQSVPLVACPACAWARGGLSLLGLPMLVESFLQQALAEHLKAVHGVTAEELAARKAALAAQPSTEPTAGPDERRSA